MVKEYPYEHRDLSPAKKAEPRYVHTSGANCHAECWRIPDDIADLIEAAVMMGGLLAGYQVAADHYPEARRNWP